MKVLLLKDVYNLGRAGDVKKVADGYGRNFLLPKNMAVLATPGMLKQVDRIRTTASKVRELANAEKAGLAEQLANLELKFVTKAGESGKLFGSITQQGIVDAIKEKLNVEIDRHQVESQPLREVGEHKVRIRLTFDLIPQVKVLVEAEEKKEEAREPREARAKGPRRPRRETAEKTEPAGVESPAEKIVEESAPAAEESPKSASVKEKKSKKAVEESSPAAEESPKSAPVKEKKSKEKKSKKAE
jgi:large subunit ribosomal protein L9